MSETNITRPAASPNTGDFRNIGESIARLTEAGRELFSAGEKIASEVNDITRRVERMTNITSDTMKSPWLLAAIAVAAGALLIGFSRRHP